MLSADVVIAGGGVAGLLLASALPAGLRVVLVEQAATLPRRKYWLTDTPCADANPALAGCIDSRPDVLDFIAADGTTAVVPGRYVLWNTNVLSDTLERTARAAGVTFLTGRRLYAVQHGRTDLAVRVSGEEIRTRLLIDCMGFGSPLVGAYGTVAISGYYLVYGAEVALRHPVRPVGLHNVMASRSPTYFELFPTAHGAAHAALILPARSAKPGVPLRAEWDFIVTQTPYADAIERGGPVTPETYFGIIPVGRPRRTTLDRVLFFGESAQSNPATSATGLTRMLQTHRAMAAHVEQALRSDALDAASLARDLPEAMSPMNRAFQECLFERVLDFNSADFTCLVKEMARFPPQAVSDLIFGAFPFAGPEGARLARLLAVRPRGLMARTALRAALRRAARLFSR